MAISSLNTLSQKIQALSIQRSDPEIKALLNILKAELAPNIINSRDLRLSIMTPCRTDAILSSQIRLREVRMSSEGKGAPDYYIREQTADRAGDTVYLAEQTSLKRNISLKMFKADSDRPQQAISRFLREAMLTGRLDHPNILPVIDAGRDKKNRLFYAMKNIQGTDWLSLLQPQTEEQKKKAEDLTLDYHLDILHSVCNAIAFAHSKKIIHKDLKPENIIIGDYGEITLVGWQSAVSLEADNKGLSLKEAGLIEGTPCYMAPEMAMAEGGKTGIKSDVYLLGGILFEILTGFPPHTGTNIQETLLHAARNIITPPVDLPALNQTLITLSLKAMSPDPQDRFETAADLQKAIAGHREQSEKMKESIRMEDHANFYFCLGLARGENYYVRFLDSILLLKEAIELWPENKEAREKLAKANKVYAENALEKENYDLALSVIDEKDEANKIIIKEILREKKRSQRIKTWFSSLKYSVLILSLILSILLIAGYKWVVQR